MANLLVRDLDDAVVDRLKERARINRRSLQGEARALLEEAAPHRTKEEALAVLDKWRKHWGERTFSDSAALIREDRER